MAYAARSFGVFQEDPINVVLRFSPDAADDASGWLFHPTQSVEREPNGALMVRFSAGGVQEMCWHLFSWGRAVSIVAPDTLRSAMAEMTTTAAQHHAGTKLAAPP
jgi:predicted DNA-binding transcriptional regulator YafY